MYDSLYNDSIYDASTEVTTKQPPPRPQLKIAMRIFGGIENPPHVWPSAVRMRMVLSGSRLCGTKPCGSCGGTIINKDWVITAAHCCVNDRRLTIAPDEISFAVGAHYDQTCDHSARCNEYTGAYRNVTGDIVRALRVEVHPKYNTKSLAWDVCLIQVETMALDDLAMKRTFLPGNSFRLYPRKFQKLKN